MKIRFLPAWFFGFLLFLPSCHHEKLVKKYRIGFSQCTGGDAWRQMMQKEMFRELSFHPELELVIKDARDDSQKQIEQIEELLDMGMDLLIVSPNEAEPVTPIVEQVFYSGIPVILVDRKTNSDLYTAYVGADNYEIGKTAGSCIANLLEGKGKIIEVWGLPGSSPASNRHQGFVDAIQDFTEIEVVGEVNGQWEKEYVLKELPAVLKKFPDVDLVYSHNDRMAVGAYQIAQHLGLEHQIHFIGVDGLPGPNGGIQLVESGILDATLLYPTGGEKAIRLASDILNHRPFDKENTLQTTVIDSRNVQIMKLQSDKILKGQKSIERLQEMIDQLRRVFHNQKVALYIFVITLVITILLGAWLYKSLCDRREAYKKLEMQNKEIRIQRNQIMEISEKVKAATKAKFRFFTNISHEFRTPLTLILGTVESILTSGRVQKKANKEDLSLMRQNALRLLRLVNQLMDFRKIENNKMKIRASENDLIAFVWNIMKSYRNVAEKRKIDFRLFAKEEKIPLWFDVNMLDKVLFNLLSNAFKFTKDGGKIHLSLTRNVFENQVIITVEDNGRGMSKEHVQHAFDRFYQGEKYFAQGTGLGLCLSKELIELQGGNINLSSKKKKGTRFDIRLPLGHCHLKTDQLAQVPVAPTSYDEASTYVEKLSFSTSSEPFPTLETGQVGGEHSHSNAKEYKLLLIEDHDDLRLFLKNKLGSTYEFHEAADGNSGLEKALKMVPDLIICDLTLPGIDGLELTKILKSDLRTSHIPIILLTARSSMEQKIEGIQTGADAFITKPFNLHFLQESIKGLLLNRALLKQHFKTGGQLPEKLIAGISKLDSQFIQQFVSFVDQNYTRQNFGMPDLMKEFGLSRTQLYRKVKVLFGQSVADYIQGMRLSKATKLLEKGELTISEIAYKVGYTSPGYFSTVFKSHFHCTPSEFKNLS